MVSACDVGLSPLKGENEKEELGRERFRQQ